MIPIAYNIGSIAVRKTTTATAVLGIGLVVFVLSSALMLSAGIRDSLGKTGKTDVAFVIRKGSDAELSSNIDLANVPIILESTEVKRGSNGKPLGVGELIVVAMMKKVGGAGMSNVQIRGVPAEVYDFRPVRWAAGRPPKAGTDEIAVGRSLRGRFEGLDLGQTVELKKGRKNPIVGIFEDGGSGFESEVWVDLDTLRSSFGREGLVSSVRAQLTSEAAFDAFRDRIEHDKQLGLEAMRETIYYEKQSDSLAMFINILGILISFFFSLGAMIGAMITMYASISSRQREVGTLRALGFPRRSILASFLLESAIISVIGGVAGCAASLALSLVRFSMLNMKTWSEVVFTFHPTPKTLVSAFMAAVVMGVLGGFLPALRAARLSPIEAMRGE